MANGKKEGERRARRRKRKRNRVRDATLAFEEGRLQAPDEVAAEVTPDELLRVVLLPRVPERVAGLAEVGR